MTGCAMIRFGSACSGIEAASEAWIPLGWEPAWYSEIEPFPCKVLAHRHPGVPNLGDMTSINADDPAVNQIDVFVAGTPCQAFSVAGLRKSLDDDRGNLSLAFCRLARRIAAHGRLKAIVWENVPGCLSTKDNAFGCILSGLVGEDVPLVPCGGAGAKWSHAGCVYGPEGSLAWRILDAQFFGLAQRRKRVFVVFCPGGWADPGQILFEFSGVRRNSPPSREAGERVAASLTRGADSSGRGGYAGRRREDDSNIVCTETVGSLTSSGRGVERAGESRGQDPLIAMCLNGGGAMRLDAESETLNVAPPITGNAYCDRASEESGLVPTFTHALKSEGADASEDGTGRGVPLVPVAYTIHGTDKTQKIVSETDIAGSLRTKPPGSQENSSTTVVLGVQTSQSGVRVGDTHATLDSNNGSRRHNGVIFPNAVRRLTPRECERLQGFPDDHTNIPGAADGPRYRATGNSMAVPVMAWIGKRIQRELAGG